ncbi:hypothetical protein BV96_03992 [Sphingomonas paucimobilis]|nr:hypothetical protein BV96_03992 [Sphingomonas paucimobilis]
MIRCSSAWSMSALALAIALAPWIGRFAPGLDLMAAVLPAVPLLAIIVLLLNRRAAGLVAAVALALAIITLLREWQGDPLPYHAAGPRLVLVTHNVSVHNEDPAATARILANSHADILLLQEVNGRFRPYLERLRKLYPYGSPCNGCSMAILSRLPTDRPRYRFRDVDGKPFGPALIQAQVRFGATEVPVATVHLSRTMSAWARARQRRMLAEAAARVSNGALIVGGDFNTTPWQASLMSLDAGMAPMARTTRAQFSFPTRALGHVFPMPLLPIDHVYAGPQWAIARAERMKATGSDHYPIRVELVFLERQL